MIRALRLVVLVGDAYGGYGGIAQYNRDLLDALDSCDLVERVYVLPRLIASTIDRPIPESVVYDRRSAQGKIAFVRRVFAHLWSVDRIDVVICGHIHLLPAAWVLARLKGARLALIIHGIEAWLPTRKLLVNRIIQSIDSFLSATHYTAAKFVSWSHVPINLGSIIPCAVDLDRFVPQLRDMSLVERYGLQSSNVILTIGRLDATERYKGFNEVIEIVPQLLERFPKLKYLIVGEGNDRVRLENKVRTLGIQNSVIFAGRIPESEKVAHYNLSDVYVMPSRGEGFGIVFIEAAACGVPVIAGGTDASRETLLDGQLGRIVDPTSPSELMEAISAALEGAMTRGRNPHINRFSVTAFRARVNDWCVNQVAAVNKI